MQDPSNGRVLLSVAGFDPQHWRKMLSVGREVVLERERPVDSAIHYAVVWNRNPGLLSGLPNLKAIFSGGAGVDHLFADPELPDVPIVRVVADNLTQHMSEYVVWRVLDHHRQGFLYRAQQRRKAWIEASQPPADRVSVGIMGLGELGRAAARALLALGFRVNGWSRSGAPVEGVDVYGGAAGIDAFLGATDILVVLLPLTPATQGMIDFALLSKLRRDNPLGGAVLINAGRGLLHNSADILRALDEGVLKEASLDVFETEPLPETSPVWTHERVFVTPHAAAASDPEHLARSMLEQMDACDRGEALRNLVDRKAGY